ERPALGGVELKIRLEAPCIEADCNVVGERVVAGEVKIDQTRKFLIDEEDVVREEVGVDDALRQSIRPGSFEELKLGADKVPEPRHDVLCAGSKRLKKRPPALKAERVDALKQEVLPGHVHARQCFSEFKAMLDLRPFWPHAFEERDERGVPAGKHVEYVSLVV